MICDPDTIVKKNYWYQNVLKFFFKSIQAVTQTVCLLLTQIEIVKNKQNKQKTSSVIKIPNVKESLLVSSELHCTVRCCGTVLSPVVVPVPWWWVMLIRLHWKVCGWLTWKHPVCVCLCFLFKCHLFLNSLFLSIERQKTVKAKEFPVPEMVSLNSFFCLTICPKPKSILLISPNIKNQKFATCDIFYP